MSEEIQPINTSQILSGKFSQEFFTFETAQLEKVLIEKVDFFENKDFQTKSLQKWQLIKMSGKAERFNEELDDDVNLEMVYIPAGGFTIGSIKSTKKPLYMVNIPEFYIGRYQVTQEQYLTIVGNNPCKRQAAKLPVVQVTWENAQIFCQKLSIRTGRQYFLPSEMEWEYACRAGTNTPFNFAKIINRKLVNYDRDYDRKAGYKVVGSKAKQVGSFPANRFGLHDMHGNVWEWCEDERTSTNFYGSIPNRGTKVNGNYDYRIMRGGSWESPIQRCSSYYRGSWFVFNAGEAVGFRVICI
jgi:eukaryotic-like serine/threonine-protein kinase